MSGIVQKQKKALLGRYKNTICRPIIYIEGKPSTKNNFLYAELPRKSSQLCTVLEIFPYSVYNGIFGKGKVLAKLYQPTK